MLKYLRIAVTALSLTACVLLIALWVRSYWERDLLIGENASGFTVMAISEYGTLTFDCTDYGEAEYSPSWQLQCGMPASVEKQAFSRNGGLAFTTIVVPFWAVVPPFVLLSISISALSIRRSMRFSLRTLLVAITLVTVALGIVVLAT